MMSNYILLTASIITMNRPLLNPKGPIHENYAVNCLQQLASTQFVSTRKDINEQLLTIITTQNMTSPGYEIQNNIIKKLHNLIHFNIEVIGSNRNDFGANMLTDFYILVTDSFEQFRTNLKTLSTVSTYNPKALFLVYYSTLEKNYKAKAEIILEKLWKKSINKAAILIPENLKHFNLYTLKFDLKSHHHCLNHFKLVNIDSCYKGEMKRNKRYIQIKIENFNNCTLDVVANKLDPFVIDENEGFEIIFLKQLGKTLNISFNITLTGEDSWGVKEEGVWTKGLGRVYEESALGIGNFYLAPEYSEDFDSTSPYYISGLVWIVPIAQYVPKWRVLAIIFSWYLWILCISLVLFSAVLLKITSLSKNESKHYKKFGNDLLNTFQIMIVNAVDRQPKSDWSRIVFIGLNFFSIIITAVYTSSLINYLTLPQREPQVDSIDGVLAKNWDIGGLPVYQDIFNVTNDEKAMQIYDIFQVNESLYIWLTSVGDDRDTASIVNDVFLNCLLARNDPLVTDATGKPKVFILEDRIFSYSVVMVANKGFPFLPKFNHVIGLLTKYGLIGAMARRYTFDLASKKMEKEESGFVQPLSIDHLQGAFFILVLGEISGFVIFLFEIVVGFVIGRLKKNKTG